MQITTARTNKSIPNAIESNKHVFESGNLKVLNPNSMCKVNETKPIIPNAKISTADYLTAQDIIIHPINGMHFSGRAPIPHMHEGSIKNIKLLIQYKLET